MATAYMYILECSDGSYYTGSTKELELRLQQHQNGEGANHTKKNLPVKLVYTEEFSRIDDAFYREKQVQGWSRKKKEALIHAKHENLPELSIAYRDRPSPSRTILEPSRTILEPSRTSGSGSKKKVAETSPSRTILEPSRTSGSVVSKTKVAETSPSRTSGSVVSKTKVAEALEATVPAMRFNEFSEPINETRFGEVVESNIYGPRFNANDYSEVGNVRTIRGTDLGIDGEIKYEQVPLALLDEKTVNTHKLQEGDIVMITTAECGATGVFRKQSIDYLSSAYGVRIRLNNLGYPYYFKYFFQTRLAKKEINSYIRKSTIANLPGSDILRIKLYNPSLPEQQKIASFLSAVDEKIQQLTKKKALLEQYKKGVMQQLFSGQLRFKPDNTNETSLRGTKQSVQKETSFPDWEEKRLGEIATKSSSNISANTIEENIGEYKLYGAAGFLKKIDFFMEKVPFISIVKDGAGVGRTLLCDANSSVLGTLDIINPKVKVVLYFLYSVLNNVRFEKYMVGSTIPHIYYKDYSNEKITIPCLEEQQKIATYVSGIDTKIESVSNQITQTQAFKKGLLQQLFV